MSSRKEEKEQRRAERVAAEEAAARTDARKRRLGIVLGVVLGLAAAGAVTVAVTSAGGGESPTTPTDVRTDAPRAPVPPQQIRDLPAAVKAAGCTQRTFKPGPNDREHIEATRDDRTGQIVIPGKRITYQQNPPVFGPHATSPFWASDGSYVGLPTPPGEALVHSLEHGRILIQYRPGTDPQRIAQLQTILAEAPKPGVIPGYNALLFENNTDMPYALAVTSWGQMLGCPAINDKVFDAIRTFRTRYVDTGPEFIPQPE